MSCYSIFGKGIAGDYSQWKALVCRGPVDSRGGEWSVWGTHQSVTPKPKPIAGQWEAAWERDTSVTACRCLGTWSVRAQEGLMGIRDQFPGSTGTPRCSLKFVWKHPRPRDLNREAGTASLRWWLMEVRTGCLLPLSQDTTAHCTERFPQLPRVTRVHSPCSLSNWEWTGEGGPAVLRAQHCGYTSPHLLNNFKSLILSKCHMHWIYQFSIRLCILKTSPFGSKCAGTIVFPHLADRTVYFQLGIENIHEKHKAMQSQTSFPIVLVSTKKAFPPILSQTIKSFLSALITVPSSLSVQSCVTFTFIFVKDSHSACLLLPTCGHEESNWKEANRLSVDLCFVHSMGDANWLLVFSTLLELQLIELSELKVLFAKSWFLHPASQKE